MVKYNVIQFKDTVVHIDPLFSQKSGNTCKIQLQYMYVRLSTSTSTSCSLILKTFSSFTTMASRYGASVSLEQCSQKLTRAAPAWVCTLGLGKSSSTPRRAGIILPWKSPCIRVAKSVESCPNALQAAYLTLWCCMYEWQ